MFPMKPFQAGANMIVSGTAVVKSDNPKEVMDTLRKSVQSEIEKRFNSR